MELTVTAVSITARGRLSAGEPMASHRARFSARRLTASTVLVIARGEIDACNAPDLAEYAEVQTTSYVQLILDLAELNFFGTPGFSALNQINVNCSRRGVAWALVPSAEVLRVLRVCAPGGGLPVADTLDYALAALKRGLRHRLELVSAAN
jgi:anti-anti-sigma factor